MNINNTNFPEVKEGDRVLWEDGNYYICTNGTWVLENN
jgi:hypothetical protein